MAATSIKIHVSLFSGSGSSLSLKHPSYSTDHAKSRGIIIPSFTRNYSIHRELVLPNFCLIGRGLFGEWRAGSMLMSDSLKNIDPYPLFLNLGQLCHPSSKAQWSKDHFLYNCVKPQLQLHCWWVFLLPKHVSSFYFTVICPKITPQQSIVYNSLCQNLYQVNMIPNKRHNIYTMQYYKTIKEKKLLPFARTWIDL